MHVEETIHIVRTVARCLTIKKRHREAKQETSRVETRDENNSNMVKFIRKKKQYANERTDINDQVDGKAKQKSGIC